MATKAEIRDRAANKLGILPIGQALQSQHDTRISASYDEVYAQLKYDGLANWDSTLTTPDEMTPHIASLVAYYCLDDYSVSDSRFQRINLAKEVADREIRKFATADWVSQDDAVDF